MNRISSLASRSFSKAGAEGQKLKEKAAKGWKLPLFPSFVKPAGKPLREIEQEKKRKKMEEMAGESQEDSKDK